MLPSCIGRGPFEICPFHNPLMSNRQIGMSMFYVTCRRTHAHPILQVFCWLQVTLVLILYSASYIIMDTWLIRGLYCFSFGANAIILCARNDFILIFMSFFFFLSRKELFGLCPLLLMQNQTYTHVFIIIRLCPLHAGEFLKNYVKLGAMSNLFNIIL